MAADPGGAELEDVSGLCSAQPRHLHRGFCRGLQTQKQCPSHPQNTLSSSLPALQEDSLFVAI